MEREIFKDTPTGHLVERAGPEGPYWAFVPNPLPPGVSFDAELVRTLSDADRALGELAGLGRTMQNPHLLISPFVRREAVSSSRIEGTQANISEVYAYEAVQKSLPGFGAGSPGSEILEVLNYVRALEYGLQRLETLPVSLRLIREIHERLLRGVRGQEFTPGEFRTWQNAIGRPPRFFPPPADEMEAALIAFEAYLHESNNLPPLVRLGLIHYQFETIHPFADGNGRIGRLLIALLLISWHMLPSPLLYLSSYFDRHSSDYYELLLSVSQQGSWREWLLFFLKGVAEQSRDAIARAKKLQDLQTGWRATLTHPGSSALLLRLVDEIFVSPVLTVPRVAATLGVTYLGADLNIRKLVEAGILRHLDAVTRPKTFVADEILTILD